MTDTVSFAGDTANTWDMSLGLLQSFLKGQNLVLMFNNNQGNNASSFLFVWGQVRLLDAAGNQMQGMCFELSLASGGCGAADPVLAAAAAVPVVGNFCVNKLTGVSSHIGDATTANCPAATGYIVKNNVGSAFAEFAIFNQALNDAALNPLNAGGFLSVNLQYSANTSGAEQLFICETCTIGQVPEPASLPLVLLGLAIAGISAMRARRK
jgi:hypothetical protein